MTSTTQWSSLRRIITGVDSQGRSKVIFDDNLPHRHMFTDTEGLHEVWTDPGNPLNRTESIDQTDRPVTIAPETNGVRFRYFTVAPDSELTEGVDLELVKKQVSSAFASVGSEHHQPDTSKHPAMHQTPTIDCITLLEGRVRLILDDDEIELSPFDTVIQRGTNHTWKAIGDKPALLMAVLIDRAIGDL
jgi:Cupin domain